MEDEGDRAFAIRIVNLDYYMAHPILNYDDCYSQFLGRGVMEVPVVRIYGSTPLGQKTCLHLHKALPYFYVPYDDDLPQGLEEAMSYIRRLAFALEQAMKLSTSISAKRQHVHSCNLVRAKKFYGYHASESIFIKITLYHPQECSRISALLMSGGILNRKFQPYESHIPYLLQILIDYNLSGMGRLHLSKVKFRSPLPDELPTVDVENNPGPVWLSWNTPSHCVWSGNSQGTQTLRMSTCELEVDSTVEEILNKKDLQFIPLAQADRERKMVQSLIPMWEGCKVEEQPAPPRQPVMPSSNMKMVLRRELMQFCGESAARPQNQNENLLMFSQPSNVKDAFEAEVFRKSEGLREEDGGLCNVDVVRASQTSEPKITDDEALELLRWMISSQKEEGDAELEEPVEERDLCKLFEGNEVEAVLEKGFSEFDLTSQRECQDILDCSEDEVGVPNPRVFQVAQYDGTFDEVGVPNPGVFQIPQYDGTFDDNPSASEFTRSGGGGSSSRSKKVSRRTTWGTLPVISTTSPVKVTQEDALPQRSLSPPPPQPQHSKGETTCGSSSMSVRDMMRRRRSTKVFSLEAEDPEVESILRGNHPIFALTGCSYGKAQYGPLPLNAQVLGEEMKDRELGSKNIPEDVVLKPPDESADDPIGALVLQKDGNHGTLSPRPLEDSTAAAVLRYDGNGPSPRRLHYGGTPPSPKSVEDPTTAAVPSSPAVAECKQESEGATRRDFGTHVEADGSVFYLVAPAKPPPSVFSVTQWLAEELAAAPPVIAPEPELVTRPASPKYDESHVFSLEDIRHTPNPVSEPSSSAKTPDSRTKDFSQLTGASSAHKNTPLSQAGFRDTSNGGGGGQEVTLMSIEVLAETRGSLRPDPRYDAITCIAVSVFRDYVKMETIVFLHEKETERGSRNLDAVSGCKLVPLGTETAVLQAFVQLVRECDPDMLMGWEIQRLSLGFLAERAANIGIGLLKQLSRTPPKTRNDVFLPQRENGVAAAEINEVIIDDEWGRTHGSGIYVGGRTVLNLWRIMRGEIKLGNYTIEAVAEAVLKRKVPRISWRDLTRWFASGPGKSRFKSIEYVVNHAKLNLDIIDQLDLVNRTAELARVFGIDFFSVFSRGSQYRVESMMLRLAHSQNFVMISPSREQVAKQPAMECLPLVMEPESMFYTSPVVVLDFQSLYPSMIIAYNLCFSTCLGKCLLADPKVLGVSSLSIQPEFLLNMIDQLLITPNNVMFVPPQVIPGVLPRLLQEILSTRIMVKNQMKKLLPSQKVLHRVLNARQFALKLIANVTYGYAAAGFSGRMPCAELADSIVQLGRHTLERAIHMVNSNQTWDARVVYGDTDSMFVLLEGRTREEAFKIGQEIASAVTACNPDPVVLKMEKVYQPCVLLTKKRYVGYSYESPSQAAPTFDAKGIETVRRDSCGAVSKTMEKSLKILFQSNDLTKVKGYLQCQWQKIISGRVSLQDFIFSKEVRLGTYSMKASVLPPAAIVASKAMSADPRAEPCYGERVQYVVVHGQPGARLVDMVVDPYLLLDESKGLRLHDTYYINKQIIPALQRVFGLLGADLRVWFNDVHRVYRPPVSKRPRTRAVRGRGCDSPRSGACEGESLRGQIDHYYASQHCTICGELTLGRQQCAVCRECAMKPGVVVLVQAGREARLERQRRHVEEVCNHCGGGDRNGDVCCISLDCSVFFERLKTKRELESCLRISNAIDQLF